MNNKRDQFGHLVYVSIKPFFSVSNLIVPILNPNYTIKSRSGNSPMPFSSFSQNEHAQLTRVSLSPLGFIQPQSNNRRRKIRNYTLKVKTFYIWKCIYKKQMLGFSMFLMSFNSEYFFLNTVQGNNIKIIRPTYISKLWNQVIRTDIGMGPQNSFIWDKGHTRKQHTIFYAGRLTKSDL